MSLTALEWGLRAPITPRFGGNLEALPRPQDTEPKQQQKTDLKHKESDRPQTFLVAFLTAFFTTLLTTFADAFLAELFGE